MKHIPVLESPPRPSKWSQFGADELHRLVTRHYGSAPTPPTAPCLREYERYKRQLAELLDAIPRKEET